jgi:hypothetical protein
MKKSLVHIFSNQHGSVINVALLILILIFLIGIGLSKMSTTDIKIANNIKQDMATFYEADAGLEAAGEMIEQNLNCRVGFSDNEIGGSFYVNNLKFAFNERQAGVRPGIDPTDNDGVAAPNTVYVTDFFYPPDLDLSLTDFREVPHTNISVGGVSRFAKGSAIQMAAGYEGLGKGAAAGGGSIIFDVYAERVGINNSASTHFMQWVHLIKPLSTCNF